MCQSGEVLRAEEVGSLKACINVDQSHCGGQVGPPLVDADWHAFCQAIHKGIEGNEWGEVEKARARWRMNEGGKR